MIRLHRYTLMLSLSKYEEDPSFNIYCNGICYFHYRCCQLFRTGLAFAQTQPNLNATSVYDSGQMILGNNVKHLIVVIPNEGHHGPGEEDESRFIAQPFLPQNAIIEPGTQVAWFNGDVGHEHNIVIKDPNGIQLLRQANLRS